MITDYRKQAQELIEELSNYTDVEWDNNCSETYISVTDIAEKYLKQISKEARLEENEACVRTIFLEAKWEIDPKIYEDLAQSIRSRMIGPEPMEEK